MTLWTMQIKKRRTKWQYEMMTAYMFEAMKSFAALIGIVRLVSPPDATRLQLWGIIGANFRGIPLSNQRLRECGGSVLWCRGCFQNETQGVATIEIRSRGGVYVEVPQPSDECCAQWADLCTGTSLMSRTLGVNTFWPPTYHSKCESMSPLIGVPPAYFYKLSHSSLFEPISLRNTVTSQ